MTTSKKQGKCPVKNSVKELLVWSMLALSTNAIGEELVRETWSNVVSRTTGLVNTTDKKDYYSTIEGADAFTISKMDALFLEGYAEFEDMSARGSDGIAFHKTHPNIGMDIYAPLSRPIDLTKSGEIVVSFDAGITIIEEGNGGPAYLSFELKGEDGEAAFKVRLSNMAGPANWKFNNVTGGMVHLIEFWVNERKIFETDVLVKDVGAIGEETPKIEVYCKIEYNPEPGIANTILGYSVGDGQMIYKKVKDIAMPTHKRIEKANFDVWSPNQFWLDNIVVGDYELGQAPDDVMPVMAVTWVNESWNNVNGGKTFILKNPDADWLHVIPPGLDSKAIRHIKMAAGYEDGEISDQSALGSDGMAYFKKTTQFKGGFPFKLDPVLKLKKGKGWLTYTCDYATLVRDMESKKMGGGGWFGPDFYWSGGGTTPFKFRQSSRMTNPVISFWEDDELVFGTSEMVSSLGPAEEFSPPIEVRCVLAYNQTKPDMWDVELGYRVAGGPWKITSRKGLPSTDTKVMRAGEFDHWSSAVFWLDNFKIEWEAGSYEVKPTGTYPVTELN